MRAALLALLVLFVAGDATALIKHRVLGRTACNDGVDNDLDGETDFPTDGRPETGNGDDGCWDPIDDVEDAGYNATKHGALVTTGNCSSSTLSTTNGVYTNCDWSDSGIVVAATGITVKRSVIGGAIGYSGDQAANMDSFSIIDSTADAFDSGGVDLFAGNELGGFLMQRVRCIHYNTCIYNTKGTVAGGDPGAEIYDNTFYYVCGKELVLLHADSPTRLVNNWINTVSGTAASCTRGDGLSGVVFYFGDDNGFWNIAPPSNKQTIHNRIHTASSAEGGDPQPTYTLDAGGCNAGGHAVDQLWFENAFVGPPDDEGLPYPVNFYFTGNTWKGNRRGIASTLTYRTLTEFNEGDARFSGCN